MTTRTAEGKEKFRKDAAKKAVGLAMQNRWEEAVAANRSIVEEFPQDMEAHNRLGKALTELGRIREAKEAFQHALEISPNNSIAKKNVERLERLGEDVVPAGSGGGAVPHQFIEESGNAGITSLVNPAPPDVLLKLAPGHPVQLQVTTGGLDAVEASGRYVGRVEPKFASRLTRLMKGGNRYEAAVTSVEERGLTIIIREVHKDPSQAGIVSFPLKDGDYRVYVPNPLTGYELADEEATPEDAPTTTVKDWSDDDTEPGDDDAYTPVLHRIINPGEEGGEDQEEGL